MGRRSGHRARQSPQNRRSQGNYGNPQALSHFDSRLSPLLSEGRQPLGSLCGSGFRVAPSRSPDLKQRRQLGRWRRRPVRTGYLDVDQLLEAWIGPDLDPNRASGSVGRGNLVTPALYHVVRYEKPPKDQQRHESQRGCSARPGKGQQTRRTGRALHMGSAGSRLVPAADRGGARCVDRSPRPAGRVQGRQVDGGGRAADLPALRDPDRPAAVSSRGLAPLHSRRRGAPPARSAPGQARRAPGAAHVTRPAGPASSRKPTVRI